MQAVNWEAEQTPNKPVLWFDSCSIVAKVLHL